MVTLKQGYSIGGPAPNPARGGIFTGPFSEKKEKKILLTAKKEKIYIF